MKPVALGVIGCGVIGRVHLGIAAQSPLVEVVAVADLIPERVEAAAKEHGIATTYAQGSELLDDPAIEAVILALPTNVRGALALKAFAKGLHALIEKPIAMDAAEAEKLIEARGDLVAVCGCSRQRFMESARAATEFVATGALGEIRMVRCRAISAAGKAPETSPPEWRLKRALNGGGIMMNWGCYDLDYVLGVAGWALKPEVVLAQTWTVPPVYEANVAAGSDAETQVAALIRCEGGAVLHYERGEYMPATNEGDWVISGTKGSLHLHLTDAGAAIVFDEGDAAEGVRSRVVWEAAGEGKNVFLAHLEDFARAVREGKRPGTELEKVLVVQRITDAIYASAREGTAVTVA